MIHEIKNRFSGNVIFSLECESLKSCIETAIFSRTNLTGANLAGAWIIDGGCDNRGFQFAAGQHKDGHIQYRAGYRTWKSIEEARAHYGPGYKSDGNVSECLARLELLRQIAEGRFFKS